MKVFRKLTSDDEAKNSLGGIQKGLAERSSILGRSDDPVLRQPKKLGMGKCKSRPDILASSLRATVQLHQKRNRAHQRESKTFRSGPRTAATAGLRILFEQPGAILPSGLADMNTSALKMVSAAGIRGRVRGASKIS